MHRQTARRDGAVLPMVALLFPVLLILAGYAINVAYMQLSQTELKIATDCAARAAGRVYSTTRNEALALNMANETGTRNTVAGEAAQFDLSDLRFGNSTRADIGSRYEFVESSDPGANAVQIIGRRTGGSTSGPVSTFFPNIMGKTSFELTSNSICTQMEVDIALVIDRSGSMAYANNEVAAFPPIPVAAPVDWTFGDPAPNPCRWRDVLSATEAMLVQLGKSPQDERVGLVTYADAGKIDVDPVEDYNQIITGLNVYTDKLSGGGTNVAGGLSAALSILQNSGREFAAKVAIVLTDGQVTVGPNPVKLAKKMSKQGILVVTVTFADEADQKLMKKVAKVGNGFHRHAKSKQDLITVFEEISKQLPTLLTK